MASKPTTKKSGVPTSWIVGLIIAIIAVLAVIVVAAGAGGSHTSTTTPSTTTSTSSSISIPPVTSSSTSTSTTSPTSTTSSSSTTTSTTTSSSTPITTTSTTSSTSSSTNKNDVIDVKSQFSNGTSFIGVYTVLAANGAEVASGYTPVQFTVTIGENYTVIVSNFNTIYFNHWSNNFATSAIPVTANSSTIPLTAVFTVGRQSGPSTLYSIAVSSAEINGTSLTGYNVDLRVDGFTIANGSTPVTFSNLEPGLQYQVIISTSSHDYYFRHFADGELTNYELKEFSSGTTTYSLQALYQYVAPAQAAALNVIAEFSNGTVIGNPSNPSATGLWVTVTLPGKITPYTASYTGGSLLPFVLPSGSNYTVEIAPYGNLTFSEWKDTGSTNPIRSITLDQNTTLIAIFQQTTSTSSSNAPASPQYSMPLLAIPLAVVPLERNRKPQP